jgi:O-antigen/teichoic acid export membrane protein
MRCPSISRYASPCTWLSWPPRLLRARSSRRRVSSLRHEARKLGANSLLYLVPNLLVRGLTFLLTPLYTRHMSVADFGVVSLCTTVSSLLGVVLGFAIASSITRMHFERKDDNERKTFYGTLTIFLLVVPTVIALLLHAIGSAGAFDHIFRQLPFRPFLALALWTAVLNLHSGVATAMYATMERPARVVAMNVAIAICQTGATILFVVVWHEGARGVLLAGLLAAAFSAVLSLVFIRRHVAVRFSLPLLVQAVMFSLPLVPHVLSHWVLSVSDRLILERHVTQADLGRYSLGYMFSFLVVIFVSAIINAISPVFTRQLKADPKAPQVPRLGTLAIAAMTFAALGAAALSKDAVQLISPPSYHEASRVVPWVVLGALMQGVYTVSSQGTWFSMNTRAMPVVTAIGAGVNVGLNLIFGPRYGIMAAAVNTAIAYAVLAGLHGWLAHRLFPIRWEYRKWAFILGAAATCFGVAFALPSTLPRVALVMLRLLDVVVGFPLLLVVGGVISVDEVRRLRRPFQS